MVNMWISKYTAISYTHKSSMVFILCVHTVVSFEVAGPETKTAALEVKLLTKICG